MATGTEPAAAPSPFVRLLAAGWRVAGVGLWRRGEVVTTAVKALAEMEAIALELGAIDQAETKEDDRATELA